MPTRSKCRRWVIDDALNVGTEGICANGLANRVEALERAEGDRFPAGGKNFERGPPITKGRAESRSLETSGFAAKAAAALLANSQRNGLESAALARCKVGPSIRLAVKPKTEEIFQFRFMSRLFMRNIAYAS
jgi:hypothetical protein